MFGRRSSTPDPTAVVEKVEMQLVLKQLAEISAVQRAEHFARKWKAVQQAPGNTEVRHSKNE